ncbi:hypothetical protein DZF91_30635 [Actinomadura logoneensis]|uniref:Uncharacterized protein n=1 Tax=Actinomadura logoneensis TaxID=2293572 RepID=A0A372JCY1_9ACTN|nr:hypothetical protein DZF91_30635 [Actinomadura logoneensis]
MLRSPISVIRAARRAPDSTARRGVRPVIDISGDDARHRPHAGRNWTRRSGPCHSSGMSAVDPLLVMRRHVDFLRVSSAACR